MSEISEKTKKKLLSNKHVVSVKTKHVMFTSEFKEHAVRANLQGHGAEEIFKQAGFEIEWFPKDYYRYCIKRWRKKFTEKGRESLYKNDTGKNSPGRPRNFNKDELTLEELRVLVEIQRETIEMLKKNRALPKQKKEK